MKKQIQILINGKKIKAQEGDTIYEVAKRNNIEIPLLCFHPDLEIKANCRICAVELAEKRDLVASCSTRVKEGMEIITDSLKVKKARKINLELIFAQHKEECVDCVWRFNCQLLKLAKKYDVIINRFKDRKTRFPIYQFKNAIIFDSGKCIDCRNCVEVCHKQGVDFLELEEKKHLFHIVPSEKLNRDCVYCGQCIVHCPVGAFEGVGEFEDIEKPLKEKDKIVVAQFAPSIRTSLGEEFGLPYGEVVTGKITAALRKLGFNKVFDTSVGADFTTSEESKEVVERIKNNSLLPVLTSCCPAWVKFIEFFYPEFVPNLTTAKSPQSMLGGLIKTYWAKKENIDPKKIIVVSIMPCVAKKYEVEREEQLFDGLKPVDYILTTRELARLIMKNEIDFKKLKSENLDSAFGEPSGAGVIYGASGGVMESAFRTTYFRLTGKELKKVDFEEVRGIQGIKKAEVKIGPNCHKIAVVNGLGNAKKLLEEIKANPKEKYTCIEVMACPGGCIGGGGQPMPCYPEIRQKRAESLYDIDSKKKLRKAHENPIVKKIYSEFLDKDEKLRRSILHTYYHKKEKEGFTILDLNNK
ncbi:MAG: [FeFe] hydrogenase, group A [Candidatus Nealsonbacteria bacterium]|nr:[FeFe] hydrogenase, group A [Candidatus Nealsonbacteria bacterium]